MTQRKIHSILTYGIALVWIINGFFCKILELVPRHEKIVANILGNEHSWLFTFLIGLSEIAMAVWILSGIRTRLNALTQMVIVATMNTIEFLQVPQLLLWGKLNSVFALLFIVTIYYNEFHLNKKSTTAA